MDTALYFLVVLAGLLLRVLIGFSPYSGEHDSPRFGDFEAQRHWMEITVNLPTKDWYAGSQANDLTYWGLDYPPLTAYHELILGFFSRILEPASVALFDSRGYETESHRAFMRFSVIVSDFLTYFAGAYLVSRLHSPKARFGTFLLLVFNPVAIWVDHAHFQYNTVAIGLLLIGVWATLSGKYLVGAMAFTASFLFKQTLMYFAPAFLGFMLGEALRLATWKETGIRVSLLGLAVIGTACITFFPLWWTCDYAGCVFERTGQVISRVFPFGRGLLEDYVANVWTLLTPIFRLRDITEWKQRVCGIASLVFTVFGLSEVFVILVNRPNRKLFPLALAATSMSFYLFSWMVHEKAILLPVCALLASGPALLATNKSDLIFRMIEASILSMWRLMKIEQNFLAAYAVLGIAWIAYRDIAGYKPGPVSTQSWIMVWMNVCSFGMILMDAFVSPPAQLPFLWILGNCATCCATFLIGWRQLVDIIKQDDVGSSKKLD
jgi:alpha-1,3-glucosyltransferase